MGIYNRGLPASRGETGPAKIRPRVGPAVQLQESELLDGVDGYREWHWGIFPTEVVEWNDPQLPKRMIQCGNLARLHVRPPPRPGVHPRRERDRKIEMTLAVAQRSHIAFDPDHPHQRLYFLLPPDARRAVRARYWDQNNSRPMPLVNLASIAGGRHATRDYPNVLVKPCGLLVAVIYRTWKQSDPPSFYIHKLGEVSSMFPILAADAKGRFWFAGGNYTAPAPGITD